MKVNTQEFAKEFTLLECIQCGRCTGGCPVSMKTALNIRGIIYQVLLDADIDPREMEVLWDCTNCLTCTIRCPKDIHPSDVIIGLRGYIIGEGAASRARRDEERLYPGQHPRICHRWP
jgi:heterodisulfide reductase subunit C